LSASYKFIAHKSFQENLRAFLERYPEQKASLFANLERARSEPFSGKAMHSLPKKLRQKVFRLWIGGGSGFRLIYYVDRKNGFILGIHLTLEPRAKFSYEKSDWMDTLESVLNDLENSEMDNFLFLNTEKILGI